MVVVHDENLPRGFWKLGRINEVIPGRDGEVRGAVVRLSSGRGILRRPSQLLYPLEVRSGDNTATSEDTREDSTTASDDPPSESTEEQNDLTPVKSPASHSRPRRAAARLARDHLLASALAESGDEC